ncbi:MAG TPA: hypothetical protein VHB02_03860 [Acidimicrobiales bacterium]|nr:hypothetical protein [Acidimicrobiales bacterium]
MVPTTELVIGASGIATGAAVGGLVGWRIGHRRPPPSSGKAEVAIDPEVVVAIERAAERWAEDRGTPKLAGLAASKLHFLATRQRRRS